MSKNIVFTTPAGGFSVPVKTFVTVEVVGHIATVAVASAVGYFFGHPVIGALVGVGIGVVGEVAEYLFVKNAINKGKLSVTIQ